MFTRAQINFDAMTKGKFAKHIERGWREICVDFEDMTSRAVEKNRFKHAALRNINHTVGTFWEGLVVHVRVIPNAGIALRFILINQYNRCVFFLGRCVDVCVVGRICMFELVCEQ